MAPKMYDSICNSERTVMSRSMVSKCFCQNNCCGCSEDCLQVFLENRKKSCLYKNGQAGIIISFIVVKLEVLKLKNPDMQDVKLTKFSLENKTIG